MSFIDLLYAVYLTTGFAVGFGHCIGMCGPLVVSLLLAAAGTGMKAGGPGAAIFKGMGMMICFGLGTVPALLVVAKLANMGWLKKREIIYRIGAILMICAGLYFIVQGIRF